MENAKDFFAFHVECATALHTIKTVTIKHFMSMTTVDPPQV